MCTRQRGEPCGPSLGARVGCSLSRSGLLLRVGLLVRHLVRLLILLLRDLLVRDLLLRDMLLLGVWLLDLVWLLVLLGRYMSLLRFRTNRPGGFRLGAHGGGFGAGSRGSRFAVSQDSHDYSTHKISFPIVLGENISTAGLGDLLKNPRLTQKRTHSSAPRAAEALMQLTAVLMSLR